MTTRIGRVLQKSSWRWILMRAPPAVETFEPAAEHEEDDDQLSLVAPPPGEAVGLVMADARVLRP
jgi:hypothetical protein